MFATYSEGVYFSSVSITEEGSGFVADWWVSEMSDYPSVLGHVSMPVYGSTVDNALRSTAFIHEDLTTFLGSNWGGSGLIDVKAPLEHVRAHLLHFKPYAEKAHPDDVLDRTVAYYLLLQGFRAPNPAVLIAEVEDVSNVRTIHDRLARARKLGILETPGQGRTHA